jgi:hypothetical protein
MASHPLIEALEDRRLFSVVLTPAAAVAADARLVAAAQFGVNRTFVGVYHGTANATLNGIATHIAFTVNIGSFTHGFISGQLISTTLGLDLPFGGAITTLRDGTLRGHLSFGRLSITTTVKLGTDNRTLTGRVTGTDTRGLPFFVTYTAKK